MSEGTFYVDCPCCGARLEARRDDGKVVKHWKKARMLDQSEGDPIKAAQARMKAEKERLMRLFDNAGQKIEEDKRQALEKFEREKERIQREGDTTPPPHPFDFE